MQDVPKALQRKGLVFACYMDPSKPAPLDPAHTVRVNYETYLFATSTAQQIFLGDVVQYCGLLTDPVTKQRFRPDDASPSLQHDGVTWYFLGEDEFEMFVRNPESFRLPGYSM